MQRKPAPRIYAFTQFLDDNFLRPTEINILQGDASKAKKILGWEPKIKFKELVKLMALYDLERFKKGEDKILIDSPR